MSETTDTTRSTEKVSFDEDADLVARLDAIAKAEGTSRAALLRRAVRRLLFSSPAIPTFGNISEVSDTVDTTKAPVAA